jgi:hypothetical protein
MDFRVLFRSRSFSLHLMPELGQAQELPASLVLGKVPDDLKRKHSHLRVTISSNHATYEESTSAAL